MHRVCATLSPMCLLPLQPPAVISCAFQGYVEGIFDILEAPLLEVDFAGTTFLAKIEVHFARVCGGQFFSPRHSAFYADMWCSP